MEKAMYGLVQAARQFWKRFVKELVEQGFHASEADPCLPYRKNELGICIVVMYVDDMLIVGDEESINDVSNELEKTFNITVEEEMTDYLICEFKTNKEGTHAWLGQSNIIKSLSDKFGYLVEDLKSPKTPGTPGLSVVKPEEKDLMDAEDQTMYRSSTGILLYLTKHSRPNISSPTRE